MDVWEEFRQRFVRGGVRRFNNLRIARMARWVAAHSPAPVGQPVALFKASTGIDDLSWNSGFHLLTSWGLRLKGVPVAFFACHAGMSRCVLGTNRDHVHKAPPCRSCTRQSRTLYAGVEDDAAGSAAKVGWFGFHRDARLEGAIKNLALEELMRFEWPLRTADDPAGATAAGQPESMPLGSLCLPGLRWILRRHHLDDDDSTRFLLREYILSAWNVAAEFSAFLDSTRPRAIVVFNGQFFPEAVARYIACKRGLRVITHEVGLQPASAFFTEGEATAYPIHIPEDFELTPAQNARLDAYLEQRVQGRFSMAGIQFWPTMRGLDAGFLEKAARFRQIVAIFTNVIFDTSQPHANTVFPDMFAWLEMVLGEIKSHPDTLFVIRAHPDETRLRKESRETVEAWIAKSGAARLANVVFIAPQEYVSSYELIQRAKFVMVYNSTIGLEASIMGVPVLCGGRARFTQYPTVFFPPSQEAQAETMRRFLDAGVPAVPLEFKRNARRFLYFQLFRTSLPFGDFLEASVRKTQSKLRIFDPATLTEAESIRTIIHGVLEGGDFLLPDRDPPSRMRS
jgi:hypothetical protein